MFRQNTSNVLGGLMFDRYVSIGPDTFAAVDDKHCTVYFERFLDATRAIPCQKPDGYEIPKDDRGAAYRVIEAPQHWPRASAAWAV